MQSVEVSEDLVVVNESIAACSVVMCSWGGKTRRDHDSSRMLALFEALPCKRDIL